MTALKKNSKEYRIFVAANKAQGAGDLAQAFKLFKKGAELGDAGSQLNLGYFLDCGLHARKNKKEAMRWYRKAYRQGDQSAANNIAILYKEAGLFGKMLWWFRRAAQL